MNASSYDEVNNDEDDPKTPYYGDNVNVYYYNEGNNYDVAPDPPTNNVNINASSDDEKIYYEVTPDTSKSGGYNKTIDNYEGKNY